jgi:GDSL-like Lipase/Acylhydrolase family
MASDYATTAEAADPYCLRDGEAAALLVDHPWKRFMVIGDSVAEGIGDIVDGYIPLPFADRVAAELTHQQPELVYRNLGRAHLRAAQVRAQQLDEALAFAPDLALVVCGSNDALLPRYDADAVDREIAGIVTPLLDRGVAVMTVSLFVMPAYPGIPEWLRPAFATRMRQLARHTHDLGAALGTVHVDLAGHPAEEESDLHSADGLHGNGRTHAIAAAVTVRRLGAHLGKTFPPR